MQSYKIEGSFSSVRLFTMETSASMCSIEVESLDSAKVLGAGPLSSFHKGIIFL